MTTAEISAPPGAGPQTRRAAADRIEFANTLRGLAAVSVLLAHLGVTYWTHGPIVEWLTGVPYRPAPSPVVTRVLIDVPALAPALGGYGVALFFVISGFVIPFSLERYGVRGFLVGRLYRIWPTYWAGLGCGVVSVLAGVLLLGGKTPFSPRDAVIHFFPPLRALADTSFIDAISWTLEIEMFFYLVCAAAAPLIRRGGWPLLLVAPALFAVWLAVDLASAHFAATAPGLVARLRFIDNSAPYIVFMFCGVALHLLQRGRINLPGASLAAAGCFALFCIAQAFGFFPAKSSLPTYVAGLATFVVAMVAQDRFADRPLFRFLSDISYPLYVAHAIVGFILLQAMTRAGWNSDFAMLVALAFSIVLAWLIHRFVEAPSHRMGQELARSLSAGVRSPALPG